MVGEERVWTFNESDASSSFFLIGIVMGVTENIIAITVTTDAEITLETIGIALLVAIPFAVMSELVVDHPTFEYFERVVQRVAAAR